MSMTVVVDIYDLDARSATGARLVENARRPRSTSLRAPLSSLATLAGKQVVDGVHQGCPAGTAALERRSPDGLVLKSFQGRRLPRRTLSLRVTTEIVAYNPVADCQAS